MIGQSILRKEDQRLLTGKGCFSDDVNVEGQAYAAFLRSPHAHARIRSINKSRALEAVGVLAVFTGEDVLADGLKPIQLNPLPSSPPDVYIENLDGSPIYKAYQCVLPADKVRFVGEPVAMVVAESGTQAQDALESIVVDYEPLPAVTGMIEACESGAPLVWEDKADNICLEADIGDRAAADEAFKHAPHTVRLSTTLSRCTAAPMEPRAALGVYEQETGKYTLYAGSGGTVRHKRETAAILNVDDENVRVIAGDVGGNFGSRNALYVEFPLVLWASKRTGRPVKWTAARTESFLTDFQGRDFAFDTELAFEDNGKILGLRSTNICNMGAYTVSYRPLIKGFEIISITYLIPAAVVRARAVLTNTAPTYPYRSSGRPEPTYVVERLLDLAAKKINLDRAEFRRRNLVPEKILPHDNGLGMTLHSGDFRANLETALEMGDWDNFESRRANAKARGRCRGIGVANYIDLATGSPVECGEITIDPKKRVEIVIGTQDTGQGHDTSFGQLVVHLLQVPHETIELVEGDTDIVKVGGGSHSGRSMRMGAVVLSRSIEQILDKGRKIAAHLLEVGAIDVEYADGEFRVIGTDRTVGLFEVAAAAMELDDLPSDLKGTLKGTSQIDWRSAETGDGTHLAEVEIDEETGELEIVKYVAVDNVGRAINPMLVDGQTHGGIAQGVGQALMERLVYDPSSGQSLSASFMDYAMPRADSMPCFDTKIVEVPSPSNPFGIKPASEGGTTPASAVVANAIVDALWHLGVRHIGLPATSQTIWRAIRSAESG